MNARQLCGAAATLVVALPIGMASPPAHAAAAKTTRCGITDVWTVGVTKQLDKGLIVTMWGRAIDRSVTGYCFLAERSEVPKDVRMSLLSIDDKGINYPGKSTKGKKLSYYITVKGDMVKRVNLKTWKPKANNGVKTLKNYFVRNVS